jgi:hypothetical protein
VEKRQKDGSTKQAVGGRQQTEDSLNETMQKVDRRWQMADNSRQKANRNLMLRNL